MTNGLNKIMQGLQESIKPSGQPTTLNDEAIKNYFEARHSPIVFGPYSVQRNAKLKNNEDETKPNNPTS